MAAVFSDNWQSNCANVAGTCFFYDGSWPASDCTKISGGDSAWVLVSTGLVFLATVRPLAMTMAFSGAVCLEAIDTSLHSDRFIRL
jgi:hypothetical protein